MSEQDEALQRVLEDYAWLIRSIHSLCDHAEKAGFDKVRIRQLRGVLETTTPLAADIDTAAAAVEAVRAALKDSPPEAAPVPPLSDYQPRVGPQRKEIR